MKNKPYFKYTSISIKPNQKGLDRIYKEMFPDDDNEEEHSAQWYRDLGLNVPEHLSEDEDKTKILGLDLELEDDEVDITEKPSFMMKDEVSFVEQNSKIGSTIYTKSGFEVRVKETKEEIINKLFV